MRRTLKKCAFSLWIISSIFIYKNIFTLFSDEGLISRQYGSSIFMNVPRVLFIVLIIAMALNRNNIRKPSFKDPFFLFLFCLMCTIIIPFKQNLFTSIIGFVNILYYLVVYIFITSLDEKTYVESIDISFKFVSVFEVMVGLLYYAGYSIPYITTTPREFERNGLVRMQGTFLAGPELGLVLVIFFLYFLCKFFYKKDKKSIVYAIIAFIGIYCTGARTSFVFSAVALTALLLKYYRKNKLVILSIVLISLVVVYNFITSDFFYEMFIYSSITEMFQARLYHWIIGFRIMTSDLIHFLFGVGLNNNVDYIIAHYSQLVDGLPSSTIMSAGFITRNPIHNSYFIIGAEGGICMLMIFIKCFLKKIKMLTSDKMKNDSDWIMNFLLFAIIWIAFYAMQGWGTLKELGMMYMIIIFALASIKTKQKRRTYAGVDS